jgi:hypothetical protein
MRGVPARFRGTAGPAYRLLPPRSMNPFRNCLRRGATGRPTLPGKTAPFRLIFLTPALGALAIAASGCTTEILRSRAASDLQCDRQAVQVDEEGYGRYVAHGCGDSATYFVTDRHGTVIGPIESPKAEAEVAPAPPPLRESPSAAGGFSFGASEDDTRRACLQAGHVYAKDAAGLATCDGTAADVGGPARASFGYCEGRLCRVSLDVGLAPAEDPSRALVRWRNALAEKYGSPSDSHEDIPSQCRHDVTPCLLDKSGSISFDWEWASQQRITLSTEVDDGARPLLNISYAAAPSNTKVTAPGL